jgi:tetratricopeptide (TPR) repeat protein
MTTPAHQRLLTLLAYLSIGFIALGSLLDAINNAVTLISPTTTLTASALLIASWLLAEFLLRRLPLRWLTKGGKEIRIRRLGVKPRLIVVGALALLWIPRLTDSVIRDRTHKYPSGASEKRNNLSFSREASPSHKIRFLVAEFDGPRPQEYGISQIIYEQLSEATRQYPEVQIDYLKQAIDNRESARAKAQEHHAAVVLWGMYLVNKSQARVTIHFEVAQSPVAVPAETGKHTVTAYTKDLEAFVVQEKLSKEMSYLTLLSVGLIKFLRGDLGGAIDRFTGALAQGSAPKELADPTVAHLLRGICYLARKNRDLALADFSTALKRRQDDPTLYILRGMIFSDQGKLNEAISDYDRAISLNPNDEEAHTNRSIAYFRRGDQKEAMVDVVKAIELNPNKANSYNTRGSFLEVLGREEEALIDFNKAIDLDPSFAIAYTNRGSLNVKKGNLDRGIVDLKTSVKIKPRLATTHSKLGAAYQLKRNFPGALTEYSLAVALDPSYGYLYNRGAIYYEIRQFENALADYNAAIADNPSFAPVYINRSNLYNSIGNYDRAIADAQRAIKLDPGQSVAYVNLGIAHAHKKSLERAILNFDKAIAIDPKSALAYYNRGQALADKGLLRESIKDLEKAESLTSDAILLQHTIHWLQILRASASKEGRAVIEP